MSPTLQLRMRWRSSLDTEHLQTALSILEAVLAWLRTNGVLIIECAIGLCIFLQLILLRRVTALERLLRDVRWVSKQ
jgi:hypothetical protein